MKLTATATAFVAGLLVSSGAYAKTADPTYYDSLDTCSITDITPNAVACFGAVTPDANDDTTPDTNQEGNDNIATFNVDFFEDVLGVSDGDYTEGLFGQTDWEFIIKNDSPDGDDGDDLTITEPGTDGSFSYTGDLSMFEQIVVVLKQSSTFSAYLFDTPVDFSDASWSTQWAGNQSGELSHLSIYGRGDGDTPQIPLPAAGWMMIAGIGGLAALRRRRKS